MFGKCEGFHDAILTRRALPEHTDLYRADYG
jgi:hypothetical protein